MINGQHFMRNDRFWQNPRCILLGDLVMIQQLDPPKYPRIGDNALSLHENELLGPNQ